MKMISRQESSPPGVLTMKKWLFSRLTIKKGESSDVTSQRRPSGKQMVKSVGLIRADSTASAQSTLIEGSDPQPGPPLGRKAEGLSRGLGKGMNDGGECGL
ncbi:hypothetical protein XENOCAPTIV_028984 [Xenoophorus captivus]|uniref:Uncharacterized protein n=1 Tax=Xenoophorus captivus TaxID=1517983 RepID=A0ABV0QFY5_9TELE